MRKTSNTKQNLSPRIKCLAAWRLVKVKPLPGYQLAVEFVDGTQGIVDMKNRIVSKDAGVFSILKDIKFFNQVHLEYGVATWANEIDLAPDAMHEAIKRYGKWILN